jgi:hypothetical protein
MLKTKIMKKIFITICIFVFSNIISAQVEIDMAGERQNIHYENGTYYIKDVNNYMLPYTGTWKYINGINEFRITLTKVSKDHIVFSDYNTDYYEDGLLLKYQQFLNGQLIYESPISTFSSGIIKEFGKLRMTIKDYGRNGCMFPVSLDLISNGNNQYNLKFKIDMFEQRNTYFEQHPNEPYFSIPNDIIMTKI